MLNFLTRIDEREADWSSIFPDHVNKHQTWGWSHRTNKIQKKKDSVIANILIPIVPRQDN